MFDVAVDVRAGRRPSADGSASCSRPRTSGSAVPPGFAHGFCVVSPVAQVEYKCTDYYDPASEIGVAWNDPSLGIAWPVSQPLLSARDSHHPTLAELADALPAY